MKNIILIFALLISSLSLIGQETKLYSFQAKSIDGKDFDFSKLKGKKILIVNTASKCGLTPQYESLQKLYKTYGDDNFTIIGFPANNFGQQEPGSNEEISEFCRLNYGVGFQMMEKIEVKGDQIHPLYQWLTQESKNGKFEAPITWNFQKFMIDENGNLVGFAPPQEKPDSERIVKWIKTGTL